MLNFAIYVSDHGFGHATRMAALAEENKLLKQQLASLTDTVDTLVLDALGGGDNV